MIKVCVAFLVLGLVGCAPRFYQGKSLAEGDFGKIYKSSYDFPVAWKNLCMAYRPAVFGDGVVVEAWFGLGAAPELAQRDVFEAQCKAWSYGMYLAFPTAAIRLCKCM
jgi:hypothetical protein